MTSAAEFQASVEKTVVNMTRLDGIVNGSDTTTVETDNGRVPSIAKVLKDFENRENEVSGPNIFQTDYSVPLLADLAGISSPAEGASAIVVEDAGTDYLDPVSGTGPSANSGKYQVIGGDWTKVRTLNQSRRDIDFGTWRGGYLDGQGVLSPARRPAVLETITLNGVDGSLFADYRGTLVTTASLNPGTCLDYTMVDGSMWESSDFYRFRRMYSSDGGFCALKPGTGGQFGVYSGTDTVSGEVANFMLMDWADAAHKGPADSASVIEINYSNGTSGRVHSATQGAYVISAKRYEREVQPGSGGEVLYVYYQSASKDGATYRINNNGQTPGAQAGNSISVPLMGIVGNADTDVLLTLGRSVAGTPQTPKWYVQANGVMTVPAINNSGTITAAPGTAITGTTAETVLATITLPANSMGPNGQIEIETFFSCTANANAKTLRVKFGGTTIFASPAIGATNNGHQAHIRVANKTVGTQITFQTVGPGHGASTAPPVNTSVNTAAPVTITITAQLADGADTMALESYYVVTHYGA